MTKQQLDKIKRRKKRLVKKRILSISILIIIVLILFFGVKSIVNIFSKDDGLGAVSSSGDVVSSQKNLTTTPQDSTADSTPIETTPVVIDWSTVLVNTKNPLPADFTVKVRTIKGTEKKYDTRAADSLEAMLDAANKAGFNMYLVSTYRTIEYQQGLFNRKVNEYKNSGYDDQTAKEEAAKWVAIPGTSEHNLGLAADIVSSTWYNNNSDLTQSFENTEHFTWLIENCTDYGFILRFPKGKEGITGIAYEPWHYRYVGVEAAKYIMENSLTLEEYHDQY